MALSVHAESPADCTARPSPLRERARCTARSLEILGGAARWTFLAIGVLAAVRSVAEYAANPYTGPAGWAGALADATTSLLAYALLGWALGVLAGLGSVAIESAFDLVERCKDQGERVIEANAALAKAVESGESQHSSARSIERSPASPAFTEIERAIGLGQWSTVESLIAQLEASTPGDAGLMVLKEQCASARARVQHDQLAQLNAARDVNDPDTVLSIYQNLGSVLDDAARRVLERDLARWFLSVIRRRLAGGKIQADVVRLAERVAEIFAATVEGASVRASLPTLRRSVGLCPRCAAPYAGIGDACPACLAGRSQGSGRPESNGDEEHPAAAHEDDTSEPDLSF
jgi:hypothetical protein